MGETWHWVLCCRIRLGDWIEAVSRWSRSYQPFSETRAHWTTLGQTLAVDSAGVLATWVLSLGEVPLVTHGRGNLPLHELALGRWLVRDARLPWWWPLSILGRFRLVLVTVMLLSFLQIAILWGCHLLQCIRPICSARAVRIAPNNVRASSAIHLLVIWLYRFDTLSLWVLPHQIVIILYSIHITLLKHIIRELLTHDAVDFAHPIRHRRLLHHLLSQFGFFDCDTTQWWSWRRLCFLPQGCIPTVRWLYVAAFIIWLFVVAWTSFERALYELAIVGHLLVWLVCW